MSARRIVVSFAGLLLALTSGCARPAGQVWLGPNIGSPDLLEMFTQPRAWRQARGSTDVLKLYAQSVIARSPAECPSCERNILPNLVAAGAFRRLDEWDMALALEMGAIKEWSCTPALTGEAAAVALDNVDRAGGRVSLVAMDEPLLGGAHCGLSLDETAARTAAFVRDLHAHHPGVRVGNIEPYPRFDSVTLVSWLDALRREGASPAFFHLDVDRVAAARRQASVAADLALLQATCRAFRIPFGVIFWGGDGTAEEAYYADVTDWVVVVRDAVGVPEHSVFQSWSVDAQGNSTVPRNLPESDPAVFSHTRLLNEGLSRLRQKRSDR